MANIIKINCPICNSKLNPANEKGHEILVCPFCENSLFMYKAKKDTKILPFALNLSIKGNKLMPAEELEQDFGLEKFDAEELEEDDELN